MTKKILITGSGGSAGIGFTRCLKESTEEMVLVGTDCNEKTIYLSETNQKVLVPAANAENYIEVLNELVEMFEIEFLHAQPDKEIEVISENRDKIKANLFLPSKEAIKVCADKFKLYKIWERSNVPVAKTMQISNRDQLQIAFIDLKLPIWLRAKRGAGGKGSLLVEKHEHAEAWIDYWKGWGEFTASEYLPGRNYGWDAIFKEGELVISHTKERLEYALSTSSPSGISGTASVVKEVEIEAVDKIAEEAIYAVDKEPNGVFSVDLKEDKNSAPCVTEINAGRFLTSSLHSFYKSGGILPLVYVNLAYGESANERRDKLELGSMLLLRSLDKEPVFLDENKVKEIAEIREKQGFAVLSPQHGGFCG